MEAEAAKHIKEGVGRGGTDLVFYSVDRQGEFHLGLLQGKLRMNPAPAGITMTIVSNRAEEMAACRRQMAAAPARLRIRADRIHHTVEKEGTPGSWGRP
jgi:hypothetical protein